MRGGKREDSRIHFSQGRKLMPKRTMDRSMEITELATEAAGHLKAMMAAADKKDKKAAFDAYRDVLRLIGRISIDSFEGRTAMLAGLIVELNAVTSAVKVKNPITAQLNKLADITDRALVLMQAVKAEAEG